MTNEEKFEIHPTKHEKANIGGGKKRIDSQTKKDNLTLGDRFYLLLEKTMDQCKIGNLSTKAAIKLLELCEDDLSRLAKMIALDIGKESFLYRNATMLASQVSDLIECFEKCEGDKGRNQCIE